MNAFEWLLLVLVENPWKAPLKLCFIASTGWNPELVHEISSLKEVFFYKRGILKNFSKFTEKHKTQSSGRVLGKDVLKNFATFTEILSFPEPHF